MSAPASRNLAEPNHGFHHRLAQRPVRSMEAANLSISCWLSKLEGPTISQVTTIPMLQPWRDHFSHQQLLPVPIFRFLSREGSILGALLRRWRPSVCESIHIKRIQQLPLWPLVALVVVVLLLRKDGLAQILQPRKNQQDSSSIANLQEFDRDWYLWRISRNPPVHTFNLSWAGLHNLRSVHNDDYGIANVFRFTANVAAMSYSRFEKQKVHWRRSTYQKSKRKKNIL